jgi:hypothetical protein
MASSPTENVPQINSAMVDKINSAIVESDTAMKLTVTSMGNLEMAKLEAENPNSSQNITQMRDILNRNYDNYQTEAIANVTRSDLQKAKLELKDLSTNKAIASTLNTTLQDIKKNNMTKIAGLNADTMTAKRLSTLQSQKLIYTRNISDNVKMAIVFACFIIFFLFCATATVGTIVPFAVAEWCMIILSVIYIIIQISRALTNLNQYHMLTQERVFDMVKDPPKKPDTKCTPDTDDDAEDDRSFIQKWEDKAEKNIYDEYNKLAKMLHRPENTCAASS